MTGKVTIQNIDQFLLYRLNLTMPVMERLGQIPAISTKIKSASTKAIRVLHVLIFAEEGDKGNRKRLMEFQGFKFLDSSDELAAKMRQMSQQLSVGDLVSVCNILALDYADTKQEMISRVCDGLIDLNRLANAVEKDDSEHNDDEDEEQYDEQGSKRHHLKERVSEKVIRNQVMLPM